MRLLAGFTVFFAWAFAIHAQFPLPVPQRPSSFPLTARVLERPVQAFGLGVYGQTDLPAELTSAVEISAGWRHALALRKDGGVLAWGSNQFGECSIPAFTGNVVHVAAGDGFSVAVLSNGRPVAWGLNNLGQTTVPGNLTDVVSVAVGSAHAVALRIGGTVEVWGANQHGQRNVPPGISDVVQVAAGDSHCVALKSDGTVVAWGANFADQCDVPPGLSGVVQVAPNIALLSNGTLVGWGSQTSTQFLPAVSDAVQIAASDTHAGAIKPNGTTVFWGEDTFGQADPPQGLSGVVKISVSAGYSLALGYQSPFEASYHAWADAYDLTGALRASNADPDRDGLDNHFEFAYGSNPKIPSTQPLAFVPSGSNFSLLFLARTDSLAYSIETTTNLSQAWQVAGVPAVDAADQTGVPENYRRKVATLPKSNRAFFRIRSVAE